jgi:AraC-like DNA-binding protein
MAIRQKIKVLFSCIEENLSTEVTLSALSEASDLSVFQITRLVSRLTGLTPMAYVRARRLANSLPQLYRGDSILAIALNWGFEYEQSYIRAFREAYGETPARFRRKGAVAQIVDVPNLDGMTVSAGGMLGQPKLIVRPAFRISGTIREYNYQDNLLSGTPLLDGLAAAKSRAFRAACRPSPASHFVHDYLVEGPGGDEWAYPAGKWATFQYSGLHALDAAGATRFRLLAALVVGHWFSDNGIYWNGGFREEVDLGKCGADYCEVAVSCFVEAI